MLSLRECINEGDSLLSVNILMIKVNHNYSIVLSASFITAGFSLKLHGEPRMSADGWGTDQRRYPWHFARGAIGSTQRHIAEVMALMEWDQVSVVKQKIPTKNLMTTSLSFSASIQCSLSVHLLESSAGIHSCLLFEYSH